METLFLFLFLKVIQAEALSWTLQVPSSVKGLPGSCVVIPCSYNYPDPRKTVTQFTGTWHEDTNKLIYHPVASEITQQYQGRTELLGDVRQKNCSLKIDPLQQSDRGPFHFRIEIGNYDIFSYLQNKVSITMITEPNPINFSVKEEVEEGVKVSASCSVSHSCPASPPVFTWSHSGQEHFQPQQLENGQWEATSTLTFQPTRTDNNKPLQCTVTYKGGQHQKTSKVLNVKYAPVNVKVEYKSNVKEGEDVRLKCTSDAHPASNFEWRSDTGAQLHKGNLYMLKNVSRHTGALYCIAINKMGQGRSSPVQLNVSYAPEIRNDSSCYYCVVNNTVGNANITLTLPDKSEIPTLYFAIASGAAAAILVILIVMAVVKKCRGRSGGVPPSQMQTMTAHKTVAVPNYSTTPRKEMCYDDEQYPSNDHIYGNMETEWTTNDDAIYTNA
ncbi:sialic acid-binding Ig-like lectin 14 isoform X1 [Thunnus maccoyii]|uniref:sialic acid-binding Ig-like lectin 14 isoform X1 n=2 Tax=Thunnus maccoyii TaxID=8240 RepID=UPI001C4D2278|nr:sialic acid-binding Ig-like lectin 14 isoform X1 [Thunnus maccoyii]